MMLLVPPVLPVLVGPLLVVVPVRRLAEEDEHDEEHGRPQEHHEAGRGRRVVDGEAPDLEVDRVEHGGQRGARRPVLY